MSQPNIETSQVESLINDERPPDGVSVLYADKPNKSKEEADMESYFCARVSALARANHPKYYI